MESEVFPNGHPGLDPGSRIDLTVITTGGTIDGADSETGKSRPESDAVKWLEQRSDVKFDHVAVMNKDSRQITDQDRQRILDAIVLALSNHILITHGTYTICETGRFLKRSGVIDPQKTILLTGAWIPFGDAKSDAPKQMEFAIRTLSTPPPGIFIAMDETLYDPDTTDKFPMGAGSYKLQSSSTGFPLARE